MEKLLHIYSQSFWHAPALVIGQRKALEELAKAIQTALATGQGKCIDAFVNDGEGYDVYIILEDSGWDEEIWHNLETPYTDEVIPQKGKSPWILLSREENS